MRFPRFTTLMLLGFLVFGASTPVGAADKIRPFVLGSNGPGSLRDAVDRTKEALRDGGFTIEGEYSPYENTHVLVVTNPYLLKAATVDTGGIYALNQRVSVVKVGSNVQVSYVNPAYLTHAYQMKTDLQPVADALAAALGKKEEFGAEGLSPRKLRKYHYTFGMEYFEDQMSLKSYPSQGDALAAVEKGLEERRGGVFKVARIDVPGEDISLFAVGMTKDFSGDQTIMEIIDFKDLSQAAHLPYEMVVVDGKVKALHPRFRIAVDFPDLKMAGENSFMKITSSPEQIKRALTLAAGGQPEQSGGGYGF